MNIFILSALGKEGLRVIKGCSDKDCKDCVSQLLIFPGRGRDGLVAKAWAGIRFDSSF